MQYEEILGIAVAVTDYREVFLKIGQAIKNNRKIFIIPLNPEKVMLYRTDPLIAEAIDRADIVIPDGVGIVLASKLNRGKIRYRVTGIDLMGYICKHSQQIKARIFLFGAEEGIAELAAEKLKLNYPGIRIAGTHNGYKFDNEKLLKTINNSGANLLFVALGSPHQTLWIDRNLDKLKINAVMGIGGSLDVIAGKVPRAPVRLRKLGMEWLYRFVREPKRVKRVVNAFKYGFLVLKNRKTKRHAP
jgi:N-acetylglucosaminyldiphosphoundecaprenol N-acetyl-beta-D-mannosaminyltransferase